jgi:hypothetical protein
MKDFKLKNWQKDHPEQVFPAFESLPLSEAVELGARLSKQFKLSGLTTEEATLELWRRSQAIPDLYLKDEDIPLSMIFFRCEIVPEDELFVQWRIFQEVDKFRRVDLEREFYSIWYPTSDDIEVFDGTLKWIVFVSHHGSISFLKSD